MVGLFVIGSGVLSAFAGWRVAVCRFRASVWRRRWGVVCVDFVAIDSHGAVMWQANGWWVVVRWWETVQGVGGAYLAAFGVETMVTWHRKRATKGG